ncbi:MAG: XdhC family protein [Deltaproteobacteria bacterium]|nr:MAG: XdhC family protein [Deltaproteobacteria bacterium]
MEAIARIAELIQNGETFCLATVVESSDSNVPVGRKAIVLKDESIEGGFGADQLNTRIRDLALNAIKGNVRRIVEPESGVRVFLDVLSEESRLLVCGAGHIAVPLARFACQVGFRVTVLDDREDFAHPSRFPDCDVIAEDFTTALRDMPLGTSSYVVVITRGHEHDVDCLGEILKKGAAYVGLIGSRRRVRIVLEGLENVGISRKRLQEVFTPIGLPIGAESPDEIALSIISELVCVRRKGAAQARILRKAVGIGL